MTDFSTEAPRYRSFWCAYSCSLLGRFVHGMALSWLVWQFTKSPLWLALIALLSALPSLPMAPIAGVVADRFLRHHILLVTQSLGCFIAGTTAWFAFQGTLTPVILAVLALLFGIVTSIDGPSMHSMLVETGETVEQAVARQSLVMNVSRAVAPMIAVAIMEWASPGWCFVFNTLAFLPMILIMAIVKIPNKTTQEERRESVKMSSFRLFKEYRVLREVLPQIACLSIFVMPAVSLLPAISLKDAELMSFGSMSSGLGFGAIMAAILMQREKRLIRAVTTVLVAGWICSIAFAVLPALESLISQWICAAIAGGALTFSLASANNAIQSGAPNMYRGRFSAMFLAVMLGLVPIGQLVVGFAAELFGAQIAVRVCAILAMILMVLSSSLVGNKENRKSGEEKN